MKRLTLFACILFVAISTVNGQRLASPVIGGDKVPDAVHLQILAAEDELNFDAVSALLTHSNAAVRYRAALAAGRIGDAAAVPALVQMLGDRSDKIRDMAAFALGEIESIEAADAILIAIGETAKAQMPGEAEGTVRGRLAEAAGKIAAANAKHPKAQDLGKAILFTLAAEDLKGAKQDKETIRLSLTAALRARPAGADEALRPFLGYTDPDIVADALNTLSRMRTRNVNRDARDLLETHVHAVVRANAARLLGAAEDKEALSLLIKAAADDKDSRVRVSAIRSLAQLRDPAAADRLLKHGDELLEIYKKAKKPNYIPNEQSEFIEVATALGRILPATRDERALRLIREFGKLDQGFSTDVYVARVRIMAGRGEGDAPELVHWRQYSTLSQIVAEFYSLDAATDEAKKLKAEAPEAMRPLAKAFAVADPVADKDAILAGPDILRAFAAFKTPDLAEILRDALTNKNVHIRATAAGLLGDLPASKENVDALKTAFTQALLTDKHDNDAQLAMLSAMVKLDKMGSVDSLKQALNAPDFLIRRQAANLIKQADLAKEFPDGAIAGKVRKYDPKSGTKLGQVLNTTADYRRALSRKNGSVRAELTTQKGSFTIDLLPEDAPLTVDNFVKLARSGYFNGLEVHRVVPNFVMQDGDPIGNGSGGPGWSIRCEMNMIPYERGVVGMALSGKDTGGSQWFVTHSPQPHLDGGYTVFGRVNETGMKVVDNIVRGDKIVSVRIVEGARTRR